MNASRDPDHLIHAFLMEGEDQLQDQVYDAVRADIEHRAQRVVIGPWRLPIMNKIVGVALAAAAVVAAVLIGAQLIGSPSGVGGPGGEPTPSPEPSVAEPTSSSRTWTGIPEGPVVVTSADDPVQVTVDMTSPGWVALRDLDVLSKNDDSLDPPQSVGGAFLGWTWPAGSDFHVYGDPCRLSTTRPETPATTSAEIAAALANQAQTDATAPVDVTLGGYTGKAITLHVPMTYEVPGATREEEFAECDEGSFAFYGVGDEAIGRDAQGPGQIDDLWIMDVDGSIVILDAAYGPAAPAELVDELHGLAESATFALP